MSRNPTVSPSIAPALSRAIFLSFILLGDRALDAATNKTVHTSKPRNLVLISIDTLRPDHLSCYGYVRNTSPIIDALAKQGRVFTNAFTAATITPPSHMSLFTSQYPFEHGVGYDGVSVLPEFTYTLAEVLKMYGYQTAAFVGTQNSTFSFSPTYGFSRGFSEWGYLNQLFLPNGQIRSWLEDRQSDEPFFLFVHGYDVHDPHLLIPGYNARRFDPGYQGPIPGTWDEFIRWTRFPLDWPSLAQYMGSATADEFDVLSQQIEKHYFDNTPTSRETVAHIMAVYDAQIYYADKGIGLLMRWLQELHLDANTLIVLVSDHGQEFGEHGLVAKHGRLYDEVMRVLLIMRGPGVLPGRAVDQLVSTIDVVPTILELLTIPVPHTARGVSLVPLLQHQAAGEVRKAVFAEFNRDVAVRTREWKFIRHADGRHELYHLARDPTEQKNVVTEHPGVAHDLQQRFDDMVRVVLLDQPSAKAAGLRERLRKDGYW